MFDPQLYAKTRRPLLEAETLPTWCYTDQAFYDREVATIFRKVWNFVGRADTIPNPGDYYTLEFVGVPLLIVRGKDGVVRALANSCRHRGAKLAEGEGSCRAFKCPYHGWTYGLDGALLAVPGMKEAIDFAASDYPLVPVRLESWGGFLFVNFDRDAEPLARFLGDITTVMASYRFDDMVCTRRKHYTVACNWKIYVENAMEAYHVPHVHRASIMKQKGSVRNDRTFDRTHGNWCVMHKRHEGSRAILLGDQGFPPMTHLDGKCGTGTFYPLLFPSTMLGCTIDCAWFLEIRPLGPARMELVVGSCFPRAVAERPDFAEIAPHYYKRWDLTTQEDIRISELQQIGVSSPLAAPGRLSIHEPLVHTVDNWVLARVLGTNDWSIDLSVSSQAEMQDLDVFDGAAAE